MRKISGIAIILISIFIGLGCALTFGDGLIVSVIILLFISLPLYIFGHITRTSVAEFKQKGKRWISIFTFLFFILPLTIHLYGSYDEYKRSIFADEQFIIYRSVSGELGKLSLIALLVLIVLLAARFLNPILKKKGLLNFLIIGVSIFLIVFSYFMFSDYRGVHQEQGLVSSTWKGEKTVISYQDIDSIQIEPYVHYASSTNSSDETNLRWSITFKHNNKQNEVVYHFYKIDEENLEHTIQIKELAMQNDIPFIVGKMNEDTYKWLKFDLELEELDRERYYKLFGVD